MFSTKGLLAASAVVVATVSMASAQTYEQQDGYLQPAYGAQQEQAYPVQAATDLQQQQPQQDYGYPAAQQDQYQQPAGGSSGSWISGSWYLKVGAAVLHAPKFDGASGRVFSIQPLVSLGKHGPAARFTSRNDNISLALIDNGGVRAGVAGKLIWARDSGTDERLRGMEPIKFGGEAGVFAEFYPTDFTRIRAEVRHGVRSHSGVVVDVAADAFFDVTEEVRISGGPRMSWASARYHEAYYGVDATESAASGLGQYAPGSGFKSLGLGGAITWKATDQLETSIFAEYSRLMGPAGNSTLVEQRGSKNQLTLGASAIYRFDFAM